MRVITVSALIGALVALPFLVGRRDEPALVSAGRTGRDIDSNLRYDIDDFLTD